MSGKTSTGGKGEKRMQERKAEEAEVMEMTERDWREQKAVAAELRRLRESTGMTRAEMAGKMGGSYTEELVAQYEDGGSVSMEIWPVFDMVKVLHARMNDLDPLRLLTNLYANNGYADLNDESRQVADRIIGALLVEQRQKP